MKTQEKHHTQLVSMQEIEFAKTSNLAGKTHTGELIALRPCVENMGLNWSGQLQALKRDPNLFQLCASVQSVAQDGKNREMICMRPADFQNWLWSLNPKSESFKVDLWEEYKKGLVLHILIMLKISLDEVQRLRGYEEKLEVMQDMVNRYTQMVEEGEELRRRSTESFRKAKDVKKQLEELASMDLNQLAIPFGKNEQ